MEKKEKIKVLVVMLIAVVGAIALLKLALYLSADSMNYEYVDVNDNWGTSYDCGESKSGNLACVVDGNFISVKQYSKIEKGVKKDDFWKK